MRTLKRSFKGTSGPETEIFTAGLDSKRTACASEEEAIKNDEARQRSRITTRTQRPGDMIILSPTAAKLRKIQANLAEQIIPKLHHSRDAVRGFRCVAVLPRRGKPGRWLHSCRHWRLHQN